jgi:four helix bundle protein
VGVATHHLVEQLSFSHQIAYGAQMRRAAVSIGSNIAEGAARHYPKEFVQSLYTSRGSAAELQTQFVILEKCGLFAPTQLVQVDDSIDHVTRMLTKMIYRFR